MYAAYTKLSNLFKNSLFFIRADFYVNAFVGRLFNTWLEKTVLFFVFFVEFVKTTLLNKSTITTLTSTATKLTRFKRYKFKTT